MLQSFGDDEILCIIKLASNTFKNQKKITQPYANGFATLDKICKFGKSI